MIEELTKALLGMKSDRVANYVIAGLDSYLLREGVIRVFENSRNHQDAITPHSHRYDFTAFVLQGWVDNTLWMPCDADEGDQFMESELVYEGEIGEHEVTVRGTAYYKPFVERHHKGHWYKMAADEIHSIEFSKNAILLIIEEPEHLKCSAILEPYVDGRHIKTYEKKPYMFLTSNTFKPLK